MKIVLSDQLFYDLKPSEVEEMYQWAEDVVLRGKIAHPHPFWVQDWLDAMNFDMRQALLVISTCLPQRVLLSVARYYRGLHDE